MTEQIHVFLMMFHFRILTPPKSYKLEYENQVFNFLNRIVLKDAPCYLLLKTEHLILSIKIILGPF